MMIRLVIGNPGSGKSKIAEDIVCGMDLKRYYIATMKVCDEEGKKRVLKHKKNREGKGFITLEIPYKIADAKDKITDGDRSVILIECMSNLIGNEIYDDDRTAELCKPSEEAASAIERLIMDDIRILSENVKETVIVSNEFDFDGDDEMTRFYVDITDMINAGLSELADEVIDVRKNF